MPDQTDSAVEEKAKELISAWVWARVKQALLPVIASVLVTQGGAAVFVPDHVKAAVASEVKPAEAKAADLETGISKAYKKLAHRVNTLSETQQECVSFEDVGVFVDEQERMQKDLDEALVMLDALSQVAARNHGQRALQNSLDAVEQPEHPVPAARKKPSRVVEDKMPESFAAFLKEKEEEHVQNPDAG